MKKRVTVIIALLACLVLAVCLFAACNDGGSTTNRGAFFTVTFDTQGGSAVDPVQVRRGGVLEQPEDPDRPGYIFAGWYLGEGKYDFGSRVSQDITLTAHWQARKITVRFVADAIAVKEIELDYGGSVAPEDIPAVPEKEGYTGVWDTVDLSGITSSVTVNAVYTFIEREVTFVLNYSGAEDVTVMTENGLIDFVPEREGYVFNGWWYSGGHTDGGYILTRRHDMEDVITEDGVTLYAEWVEEKEYASQLSAPSVSIDGSRFSWQEIEGATGYEVSVNTTPEESVVTVTDTYFDFPYYYSAGDYTVRIRARGDGTSTRNSAWTSKQYAHKILAAPTRIEINDTTSVLTWNGVMNASDYEIYVNGELKATVSVPHYDMSGYDAGEYRVRITAKSSGWISTSAGADIMKARLKAPEVTVTDTYDGYLLTWNAVVNADTYIVTIGEEEFRTDELSFTVSCGNDGLWQDLNELTVTVAAFDSGTDYLVSTDVTEKTLTRKYSLTLSSDAGDVSGEGWYKAGERVNINAEIPTYAASSWLGWYKDGEKVSDTRTYTFAMPSESMTLTARWIKVIAQSEDTDKGTVTPLTGTYFPGNKVTVTATTNLGYTFIGWYKGGEKVSDTLTHTFKMPAENATYTARWELNDDMQPFIFSSDPSSLTITGVRDASVTEIMIPEYVTHIGGSAFSGCSSLESITIPFVGATKDGTGSTHFGYIFGASYYYHNDIYVPASLKEVIITGGTSIGSDAFYGCSGLTSVTIGNGVTSIGWYAFYNCSGLTSVTIGNGVTWIGDYAFEDCTSLTSVTIGNGVTSISDSAFDGCSNLTSIEVDEDSMAYASVDGILYNKAKTKFIHIPDAIAGDITIPDGVTGIGDFAFYNCGGLTSVTIGNGVTSIGDYAFYGCTGLTSVTIGNGVTSVGDLAFYGCTGLKSVTIENGVTSVGDLAFYGCSSLKSVTIPDSVTSIGSSAFSGCVGLTSIIIPDSVTSIGDYTFSGCTGLTSITIPDSVTSIGYGAFDGCSGLTSVTIGNGVTSVGDLAFYGCSSLKSVTIPDSVTSIGYQAFEGCNNLEYNEYDNAYYLGNETNPYLVLMKAKDTSITSCVISEQTKVIYALAFAGCTDLTSITIPDSVTSIGSSAFSDCSGLTSITIPDGVTSIGVYAFLGCSSLKSVTIPDSVTSIEVYAFSGCSSLKSVMFENTTGWYRTSNNGATSGTSLSSSSLSTPSTAATWLRDTYSNYYWKRNV